MSFVYFLNSAGSDALLYNVLSTSSYKFTEDEFEQLFQLTITHNYYTSALALLDRCYGYKNRDDCLYKEFCKAMIQTQNLTLALFLVQFMSYDQRNRFINITGRAWHTTLVTNVNEDLRENKVVPVDKQQLAQIACHLLQYIV